MAVVGLTLCLSMFAVSSAKATTKADLVNAPVPSLCQYPAGTLVDGELPGVEPGYVSLRSSTLGQLISGDDVEGVSILGCSHGGIGWADNAVFYNGADQVIGQFDSGQIGERAGRQTIAKVAVSHGAAVATVVAVPRSGDNELWGSSGARVVYRWDDDAQQMTQRSASIYTETATAKTIIKAAKAGKKKTVRKYASRSLTRDILSSFRSAKRYHARISFDTCYGSDTIDNKVPGSGLDLSGSRGCVVEFAFPDGPTVPLVMVMNHPSKDKTWRTWKASSLYTMGVDFGQRSSE